jgi:hypothetical protein
MVDGGVFAVNVVADFGLQHGAAHGGRGLGDGVAAKIDHAVKKLLEHFVRKHHAAVGEAEHAAGGFEQAGRRSGGWARRIAPLFGLRSDAFGEAQADEEAFFGAWLGGAGRIACPT